jgi:hypothetical protein
MDPLYVFEGYTIEEPWVIVLAFAHNYERLKEVLSDETNGVGVCDVGDQCARGTRASSSCGICIAECPRTRPDARPKVLATMASRLSSSQTF